MEETPYYDLLEQISFLKAARNEASYIDIETVRQKTCLIVTEGKHGSRVYSKDHEYRIPAFPATEVDPTGAGDSFLAGFSAGLYQGLPVEQAVLMGNYFGGLAVAQVGIPKFLPTHLEVLLQPSRKHFTQTFLKLNTCGVCKVSDAIELSFYSMGLFVECWPL